MEGSGGADAEQAADSESVGARLKLLRRRLGISQRELARRAGIPNGNLSLIEQGKVSPSVSSLAKILDAANLSLKDFFALSFADTDPVVHERDFVTVSHQGTAWRLKNFDYLHASVRLIRSSLAADTEAGVPPGVDGRLWVGVLASGEVELVCHGAGFELQAGSVVELASVNEVRLVNKGRNEAMFIWFVVS